MQGGAELEIIELLDADPSVFGASTSAAPIRTPRAPRPRPTWLVPAAVATVSIVAVAATAFVWKPWVNDFDVRLAFPPAAPVEPTLTEQLVFDIPPADLTAASLGTSGDEFETFTDFDGYFFAEPGAEFKLGQGGTGRWLAFYTSPYTEEDALEMGQGSIDVTVQGAPGELIPALDDQTLQLTFGPLDGQIYQVVSSEVSQADTLAFAEVIAFDDGTPVVDDISVLDGMLPMSSLTEFNAAYSLVLMASTPRYSLPGYVTALYGTRANRFSVTSQWAPEGGLTPLQFVLGGEIDATVHGEPALTVEVDTSESVLVTGVDIGSVVAWVEAGRLVMVTGQVPVDELLELAETVRPATDAEWQAVSGAGFD